MRLVIDMQGAQTASRFRGIGRYTMAFARAMLETRANNEVLLILNGALPESIEPIRAAFDGLLPQENILVFDIVGPVDPADPNNDSRRHVAEIAREAFLASLQPDVVLLSSLFEAFYEEAVTSIAVLTTHLPTAVILYDLIPLIYRRNYLNDSTIEYYYLNKLDHLRRADLLLSISASSGREAVRHLQFPKQQITNISTACDAHFRPLTLTDAEHISLSKRYGIDRVFVMYTGGIDHRKNVEGLIRTFAQLPQTLRSAYQLVIVGREAVLDNRLAVLAQTVGLSDKDIVFTGFVPDDDLVILYNAAHLFVFPSWHEGFGLPVLEAMACGKAVLAANSSSLPEVVGLDEALFDPAELADMGSKIERILTDEAFRTRLEQHGLRQAKQFSWHKTARQAWQAVATLAEKSPAANPATRLARRPKLAYISPLPPEKTGIADYSAELLPELARHYEITVITEQQAVAEPWVHATCAIHNVAWLEKNIGRFERLLYHFGNSPFHSHMFGLLQRHPGVVVLHDFFLSGVVAYRDMHGETPGQWARTLQQAHGWQAVRERFTEADTSEVIVRYPCNLPVLQQALGVIVHSDHSRQLAQQWYGQGASADWSVIPLLRAPAPHTDRQSVRRALGLNETDFVVASFGMIAPTKQSQRLLEAWLASPLSCNKHCHLVFIGERHGGKYGTQMTAQIKASPAGERIKITGWVGADTFRQWLVAADAAVQLRTHSRGETSASALDCLNYGLPTIVNAHGSLAELPVDVVKCLADKFSTAELSEALSNLWRDTDGRTTLGQRGWAYLRRQHAPRACTDEYVDTIERAYERAHRQLPGALSAIVATDPPLAPEQSGRLATTLACNHPPQPRRPQILVDVSALVQTDLKTGIERVVRAFLQQWLHKPPTGWTVEPVYASADRPGYRYARHFTAHFLGIHDEWDEDEPVDTWSGDVFIGLDLQHYVVTAQENVLTAWRQRGVKVWFVLYDLLPVLLPRAFPDGVEAQYQRWLAAIARYQGIACISRAVVAEVHDWLTAHGPQRERPLQLSWFHLGADVERSVPTLGIPKDASQRLAAISSCPSFLMVGTIEPRKGHLQVLAAFEQIWARGVAANLIIVGKEGWQGLAEQQRRTIPTIMQKLRNHPQLGQRLFWLDEVSDEYLGKIYSAATCLIAASEGEGFGLPLIEAAQHRLPILARDIAVFREVAGEHASYFPNSLEPTVLAEAMQNWLDSYHQGNYPRAETMAYQTWEQSAGQVLDIVLGKTQPYLSWLPERG